MRTPDEAILQILRRVGRDCPAPATLRTELVPIAEADGRVLARDVASDLDLPPFEKSAMDGFAVRSADFVGAPGSVALRLVGESRANAPFTGAVPPGACIELS